MLPFFWNWSRIPAARPPCRKSAAPRSPPCPWASGCVAPISGLRAIPAVRAGQILNRDSTSGPPRGKHHGTLQRGREQALGQDRLHELLRHQPEERDQVPQVRVQQPQAQGEGEQEAVSVLSRRAEPVDKPTRPARRRSGARPAGRHPPVSPGRRHLIIIGGPSTQHPTFPAGFQ